MFPGSDSRGTFPSSFKEEKKKRSWGRVVIRPTDKSRKIGSNAEEWGLKKVLKIKMRTFYDYAFICTKVIDF